jgi:hypothetical protein
VRKLKVYSLTLRFDKKSRIAILFLENEVGESWANVFFDGHHIVRPSENLSQDEVNDLSSGISFVSEPS